MQRMINIDQLTANAWMHLNGLGSLTLGGKEPSRRLTCPALALPGW